MLSSQMWRWTKANEGTSTGQPVTAEAQFNCVILFYEYCNGIAHSNLGTNSQQKKVVVEDIDQIGAAP
jgi:hypothetical protein